MYVLGDVPLILQGAGSREKLSAAQSARVRGMVSRADTPPLSPARVGFSVPSVLLYAAIGLAVAGFIRSSGGKNW